MPVAVVFSCSAPASFWLPSPPGAPVRDWGGGPLLLPKLSARVSARLFRHTPSTQHGRAHKQKAAHRGSEQQKGPGTPSAGALWRARLLSTDQDGYLSARFGKRTIGNILAPGSIVDMDKLYIRDA